MMEQAPLCESLGSFYPQFRASIFVITNSSEWLTDKVIIRGSVLGCTVELQVPVNPAEPKTQFDSSRSPGILHILAARALVQKYEEKHKKDEETGGYASSPSQERILRIALRYGIISSMTSFVAIDETTQTVVDSAQVSKPKVRQSVISSNDQ